jgi:Glycosyl transferase family 41
MTIGFLFLLIFFPSSLLHLIFSLYCYAAWITSLPSIMLSPPCCPVSHYPLPSSSLAVFGLHNREHFHVTCYALSPTDGSVWRHKIESEAETFKVNRQRETDRKRERERRADRQTDRQTERKRETDRQKERDRETETGKKTES